MGRQKSYNLFTFFSLYIAQSVPMSFFAAVLPILMRQGAYSLTAIALIKLIKIPWIIKFLWSPLVDRHTKEVLDYKRWIVVSEILYALIILVVALLKLDTTPILVIGLIFIAFLMSATQDIATDALAARSFLPSDRGLINSMQSMGSFAGSMVGSGVLLVLFHKLGWHHMLPWVALFVLVALIPLLQNKGIELQPTAEKERPIARPKDMLTFFTQKGIYKHVIFLLLFYTGIIGLLSNLRPMMVDFGYEMKEIGFIVGICGTAMGILGSFLSGLGVKYLGRKWMRRLVSLLIVGTATLFLITYNGGLLGQHTPFIFVAIGSVWLTYGMASTLVYTTSMDLVRSGREGTDFTLQIVVTHLSSMLFSISFARVADVTGYQGLFTLSLVMGLLTTLYIWFYNPKKVIDDSAIR
ncbi:MFS transporter [uncultured Porphyromonas sp.]|uniref:MFS transporter n=1 Tax=uncultured Porphyromonas sp. TaxID=159274 RepID=UPI00259282BD|nr:MFS transporter [uncultured Porphyromonas sp.]